MQTIKQTSLRWALVLAALLALFAGVAAGARAATGGASSPAATPSSSEGIAFGAWRYGHASWYGPGLWGNKTACGQTLQPQTMGVAHKTLPCGTDVKFVYRGKVVVTQVIDRGPYIQGRTWDFTKAVSDALEFGSAGVGRVRYAVEITYARR